MTGVTYRNPALLAKTATTLDVISGGRAIFGIGAAWYEAEHDGYGFDVPADQGADGPPRRGADDRRAMFTAGAADLRGPLLPGRGRPQRPAPGPAGRPADPGRRRRRAADAQDRGQARRHDALVPARSRGAPAQDRRPRTPLRGHRPRSRPTIERTMAAPVLVAAERRRGARPAGPDPRGPTTVRHRRRHEQCADGASAVPRRGFTGFTFNNPLYRDAGADRGSSASCSSVVAVPTPREAVPLPGRARRRRRRQGARRGRPPRRVDRLRVHGLPRPRRPAVRVRAAADDGRGRHRAAPGRRRSSSTTTCATRRCSPRTWRRSTCISGGRVEVAIGAGWNRPEYEALGIPFDPVGDARRPADRGRRGAQGLLRRRAVQLRRRALHDHRARRASRSRSSSRSRRCSSAVAGKRRADARRARGGHRGPRAADAGRRVGPSVVRSDPRSITVAATEEKLGWIREAAGDRFDALEINVYPSGTSPMLTDHRAQGRARTCSTASAAGRAIEIYARRVPRVAARVHRVRRRAGREAHGSSASGSASARSWSATWTRSPRSWSGWRERRSRAAEPRRRDVPVAGDRALHRGLRIARRAIARRGTVHVHE